MEPQAYAIVAEIIVAQLLMPRIYQRLITAPPVMVVIDEADYLCSARLGAAYPEGYTCIGQMAKQGRGFGISGCFSVSVLGKVSEFIRNNMTYLMTYMQTDYQSLIEAAKTLLMRFEGAGLLGSLPPGMCVYRDAQGPCPFPMLARMDLMPASDMPRPDRFDQHPVVPDVPLSEIPNVLAAFRTSSSIRDDGRCPQDTDVEDELPDMSRKLLDLASLHPYVPVKQLWAKLGSVWPQVKADARDWLSDNELATFAAPQCGSRKLLLILPTEKGWRFLKKQPAKGSGRGGIVHRHFCHFVRDWHERRGIPAFLEWIVPSTTHAADVAYQENRVWHCVEVLDECYSNLPSHLHACFLQSSAVASVTIIVAQKAMLKEVQALAASDASLFPYMNRIHFDVIEPYIPKE
jgi:hypothetical protein